MKTTALKVEKAVNKFSVLGKQGVVLLEKAFRSTHFLYNFYPASSELDIESKCRKVSQMIKINGRVGHSEDLISDAFNKRKAYKYFVLMTYQVLINKEQGIKNNELIFRKLETN